MKLSPKYFKVDILISGTINTENADFVCDNMCSTFTAQRPKGVPRDTLVFAEVRTLTTIGKSLLSQGPKTSNSTSHKVR